MHHNTLVKRYLQLLKDTHPHLIAVKDPQGSLALPHILWMLEKMDSPSYQPLTTHSAWISWVQASLFQHNLINIQHERDITREIMARENLSLNLYKHQKIIETIEHLIQLVENDLERFEHVTMHNSTNCIMTLIYGCFEAGMEHYFGIEDIFSRGTEPRSLTNADYLVEALFGMDSEVTDFIDGFVMATGTEDEYDDFEINGTTWINNARIVIDLLKEID